MGIFFEKLLKNLNFFNFLEIEKILFFMTTLVQNHSIDQNFAKISLETSKKAFSKMPKTQFLYLGPPLDQGSLPLIYHWTGHVD